MLRYNRALKQAIMFDRIDVSQVVNATLVTLDDAPKAYSAFDAGVPRKFVIDPHGTVAAATGLKYAQL